MPRYFMMKELENNVPRLLADDTENMRLIKIPNLNIVRGLDYIAANKLISSKLKQPIELYLPEYDFIPVVYLESGTKDHLEFWRFEPPIFESGMTDGITNTPIIFSTRPFKGISTIVIHLAVAESILRRGILGLTLMHLEESL